MTFAPRTRLFAVARSAPWRAALGLACVTILTLALSTLSGCNDNKVGRVCDLDVADAGTTMTGTTAIINGQAVECPTRICLLPVAQMTTNTTSLCTQTCSSDDDCSDGELGSGSTSKQCKTGFVCIIPTTVGDFCCQHMCVCKDFVDTGPGSNYNATPVVCQPGMSMCKNVH